MDGFPVGLIVDVLISQEAGHEIEVRCGEM